LMTTMAPTTILTTRPTTMMTTAKMTRPSAKVVTTAPGSGVQQQCGWHSGKYDCVPLLRPEPVPTKCASKCWALTKKPVKRYETDSSSESEDERRGIFYVQGSM
jgi:hypothetical protein